ncbi:hypothetical protein EVAR_95125_1 [Eumeta japonica]|uniref:Uncharacterized protein n=1 Tax=Eumeta variegata TaxID=151549 RepID=A0A4C1W8F6_EUMVA|nr:hypothetical protein EVAR_95125_1 [Eumeta japonica]
MSVEAEPLRLVFHPTSHAVLLHESYRRLGVIFIEPYFFMAQAIKPRPPILSGATGLRFMGAKSAPSVKKWRNSDTLEVTILP